MYGWQVLINSTTRNMLIQTGLCHFDQDELQIICRQVNEEVGLTVEGRSHVFVNFLSVKDNVYFCFDHHQSCASCISKRKIISAFFCEMQEGLKPLMIQATFSKWVVNLLCCMCAYVYACARACMCLYAREIAK